MKPSGKSFFVSEQRKPLHRSNVNLAICKHSEATALPFLAHPQMRRHACGFALADQGAGTRIIQNYLDHRNIQHTARTPQPTRRGLRSSGGRPTNGRGPMMAARRFTAFRKIMGAVPRPDEVAPPG
jgi:integrase